MPDQVGSDTGFNKQVGPLKAWQWILAVAAVGIAYYFYRSYQNNQAANAANTLDTTGTDTSAIDPNTGIPYAQEVYGSAGASSGYGYDSIQSQLTNALYDPATGTPYYQELGTDLTSLTTAEQTVSTALGSLQSTVAGINVNPVVEVPPATGTPPISSSPAVTSTSAGSGGSGTSTGSPPPAAAAVTPIISPAPAGSSGGIMLSYLPIAQQIQMVMSGQANKNQLGPNALKIYNAGGVSTALPTRAAVLAHNIPSGAPPGAAM